MKIKHFHWNNSSDKITIIDSVRQDEVNLGSSDTVLGLFGRTTEVVYDKLNEIKKRKDKQYIILIGSIKQAGLFTSSFQSEILYNFASRCWPGPVTLIVNALDNSPEYLKSSHNTIALRIPAHNGLLAVLKHCDGLFSTSANKSGEPIPKNIDEVDPAILKAVTHVILDDEHFMREIASTILDCTGPDVIVVREGAYSVQTLEQTYGKSFKRLK